MKHPETCDELNPNCEYLYIPQINSGNPDRITMVICQALNVTLQFEKERGDWIKSELSVIHPDWECPYWQQGRKENKYPHIQKRIT